MEAQKSNPSTIDEYISDFPAEIRERLNIIRALIRDMVPEATEAISYGIPTFKLKGNLIHFAAFKNHIGLYPSPDGMEAFKEELSRYKHAKGSVQFPLKEELPLDLIRRIVEYRVSVSRK